MSAPAGAFHIRPATPADAAAIAEIYGQNVLHGTGTFEEVPPIVADIAARMEKVLSNNWPWIVAEIDGKVAGYAYAAQFRDRSAYRYCCEDSIYIDADMQGRGLGNALLTELVKRARHYGFTTMLAIIGDSANAGSIAIHRKHGFAHIGTMTAVGYKFDRWLDVVTMQLTLSE